MPPLSQRGSQSVIITLPPSRNQHREGTETDSATSTGELSDMATFPGPPAIGSKNPTPKRPSMAMDEHVQMGSYRGGMPTSTPVPKRLSPRQINKRLSLLMMLYPLAYLLLFSVSVGRLIATLVTDAPTHPALTNIARWLVFGQGESLTLLLLLGAEPSLRALDRTVADLAFCANPRSGGRYFVLCDRVAVQEVYEGQDMRVRFGSPLLGLRRSLLTQPNLSGVLHLTQRIEEDDDAWLSLHPSPGNLL